MTQNLVTVTERRPELGAEGVGKGGKKDSKTEHYSGVI